MLAAVSDDEGGTLSAASFGCASLSIKSRCSGPRYPVASTCLDFCHALTAPRVIAPGRPSAPPVSKPRTVIACWRVRQPSRKDRASLRSRPALNQPRPGLAPVARRWESRWAWRWKLERGIWASTARKPRPDDGESAATSWVGSGGCTIIVGTPLEPSSSSAGCAADGLEGDFGSAASADWRRALSLLWARTAKIPFGKLRR